MEFTQTNLKIKKRVMTTTYGKHAKELKKVYSNKKDANDYIDSQS